MMKCGYDKCIEEVECYCLCENTSKPLCRSHKEQHLSSKSEHRIYSGGIRPPESSTKSFIKTVLLQELKSNQHDILTLKLYKSEFPSLSDPSLLLPLTKSSNPTVSANAISILNYSNFAFFNNNFSFQSFKESNLDNSRFNSVNLDWSDLRNSSIRNATLLNTSMNNANLLRVSFGFSLYADSKEISVMTFSKDHSYMAYYCDPYIKLWKSEMFLQSFSSEISSFLAFSPNNKYLASCSDESLSIWDLSSKVQSVYIDDFSDSVTSISFSSSSDFFAVGSLDEAVRLYSLKSLDLLVTFNTSSSFLVTCVAFSPDNRHLACSSDGCLVHIWDLFNQQKRSLLRGPEYEITDIEYSHNGEMIACIDFDSDICIWQISSQKILYFIKERSTAMAFSYDDRFFAYGGYDESVTILDFKTDSSRLVYKGYRSRIFTLDFSHSGLKATAKLPSCTVKVWEITRDNINIEHVSHQIKSLALSFDQKVLVSRSDFDIIAWNMELGTEMFMINGDYKDVSRILISFDNAYLAIGTIKKTLEVLAMSNGEIIYTMKGFNGSAVAFSPAFPVLAVGAPALRLLNFYTKQNKLAAKHDRPSLVSFSLDGQFLAYGLHTEVIKCIKVADFSAISIFRPLKFIVNLKFSKENLIVVLEAHRNLLIFDIYGNILHQFLQDQVAFHYEMNFSGNFKYVVCQGEDLGLAVWNYRKNENKKLMLGMNESVKGISPSEKGLAVLSLSPYNRINFWKFNKKKLR